MRRYYDYTDEISPDELYDGLVGFGLFAEKIPNFLTSEPFLIFSKTLPLPTNGKAKDYIRYSSMRNINVPRPMAIPEPFAHANQCRSLADNWNHLSAHFRDNTFSDGFKISRIHLRKLKDKPYLFEMNYKNFSKDGDPEQDIVIKSRYLASADIANCFPSIYSHSISWSLVGKAFSKGHKDPANWFNQLDYYTRNVKFGETNGVLIGPHTSNLISELILVAVDSKLSQRYNYVRNIDDYTCFVESYEEAESFFLALSEELKEYELSLNSKKFKITPLPQAGVKNWVNKLNHFYFTNTYIKDGIQGIRLKELKGFLDYAIELMLIEGSDASIINYAMKIISNKYLGENAKEYYIKQLHHLVLLYPYLIHLLEENVFEPHKIGKQEIKKIGSDIYTFGIKNKIFEACSYAVYWALKYDFEIDGDQTKQDSISSNDCIFLMISFLYDKKYRAKGYLKEYKDHARILKVNDFDRYWLFIFETLGISELVDNYKIMKRNGLTFIRPEFS